MRKGFVLLFFLSASVFAEPTIFGMELGKMKEQELKAMYSVTHTGINKYSNGSMYSVPVSSINFDGLKSVTTIFSRDGSLVAVLTTFPKHKFDYLKDTLSKKYNVVSQQIPFVGNKKVTYREENTEISLDAPHMSFEMSMNYIRDDLRLAFDRHSQAESRQKQEKEASQL